MSKSGPFGLYMGMSLGDLDFPYEDIGSFKYKLTDVPKRHSAFDTYIVQITPNAGLSWVKGMGRTIETNVYGNSLQSEFESMEQKLAKVYGKYEKDDYLLPDSIWDEPRDWMAGLENKERVLMATWSASTGAALKDSVAYVILAARALTTTDGFIVVEYSFENAEDSDDEISAYEDDAL